MNVQIHRESEILKLIDPLAKDLTNDRYNRDLYNATKPFFANQSNNFTYYTENTEKYFHSFQRKLKMIKSNPTSTTHDYTSLYVSDLEAESITCPLYITNHCYKKMIFSFISQAIVKENINEIVIYTENDVLSNEHYNEVILPQHAHGDYLSSLSLYSTTQNSLGSEKLGIIDKRESEGQSIQHSTSPWLAEAYEIMEQNLDKVALIIKEKPRMFTVTKRRGQRYFKKELKGRSLSKFTSKPEARHQKVSAITSLNMMLLDPLQKNVLHEKNSETPISMEEHDYLMQRAYKLLTTFINFQQIEESEFESLETQRFELLIECVFILAKAARLDVISKYTALKELKSKFKQDKVGQELIKQIEMLIEAIECYQLGKWESAVNRYTEFLHLNYQIMTVNQWLRIYETVWYLAIATYYKYSLYLPVSAFNFLYEDCKIIEDENDYEQNYYNIHSYEREIDLETPKEKNPEKVFIKLLNNFRAMFTENSILSQNHSQKVLI